MRRVSFYKKYYRSNAGGSRGGRCARVVGGWSVGVAATVAGRNRSGQLHAAIIQPEIMVQRRAADWWNSGASLVCRNVECVGRVAGSGVYGWIRGGAVGVQYSMGVRAQG